MAAQSSRIRRRFHSSPSSRYLSVVFFTLLIVGTDKPSHAQVKLKSPIIPQRRWQVLYSGKPTKRTSIVPLDKFSVLGHDDLQFIGPQPGDQYQLGKFKTDGTWAVRQGQLQRITGKNAAIIIAEADNFELEGRIDASGLGGWFILMGFKDGNGYALYNVTFKKSGSPWFLSEFADGEALDTGEELQHYDWKAEEPLWLSVKNKKLNLTVGNKTMLIRDQPLPHYTRGQLLIGTYDTNYGPRDLRIKSLRIRLPNK